MFVPIVNELFIQAGADDGPGVGPDVGPDVDPDVDPDVGPDQNGTDPELENIEEGGNNIECKILQFFSCNINFITIIAL